MAQNMKSVEIGIERLTMDPPDVIRGKRLGLLANQASVGPSLRHSRDIMESHFPGQLKVLFSPQHGFFGEKQDNMIPSHDLVAPILGTPVFSLYGDTRIPTRAMLEPIDALVVDLQDVGTRVYTFIYTMALCMQAARSFNKEVIVLDRPNPLGGRIVEGNCLREELSSFVGMYSIPMRHGLTIGELALLFNDHFGIGCELTVVPMAGWNREMLFQDTGLPWIPPSPNLPSPSSAMVYPGQVLWEGTNVSEGRGTTQPFEIFGAPFLDPEPLRKTLDLGSLSGLYLRPLAFEPTSNKWKEQICHGFQIHVLAPESYRPYFSTLALVQAVFSLHRGAFQWKSPPYEYEYEKLPFDLITGDRAIREAIEDHVPLEEVMDGWEKELLDFQHMRKPYLLYD